MMPSIADGFPAARETSIPSQNAWNGASTSWAVDLPGVPQSASAARQWATAILADSPHAYAVVLIISELVTNAVLHSASGEDGGRILARLEVGPDGVKVSVLDQGPRRSPGVPIETKANTGRGFLIVDSLAANCGESTSEAGHRAWALIA